MSQAIHVAIVDYGLGNLFSIQRACETAGLAPSITSCRDEIENADLVILPGVGAFGDAMRELRERGLAEPLKKLSAQGRPLVGVCLGMQLLMEEGFEFGRHEGLGIVKGSVIRFENPAVVGPSGQEKVLKVPQVGWNRIVRKKDETLGDSWSGTPLDGLKDGEFMYFVHSYYVRPEEPGVILSLSRYGHIEFCSSLRKGNTYGFQFHPERSGNYGIGIYQNLIRLVRKTQAPMKEAYHG